MEHTRLPTSHPHDHDDERGAAAHPQANPQALRPSPIRHVATDSEATSPVSQKSDT